MIFTVEYRDLLARERVLIETDEYHHAAHVYATVYESPHMVLVSASAFRPGSSKREDLVIA